MKESIFTHLFAWYSIFNQHSIKEKKTRNEWFKKKQKISFVLMFVDLNQYRNCIG